MQERLEFFFRHTGGKIVCGDGLGVISAITTDTRKMTAGSLFIALKGERFDGNDYVLQALAEGAAAALVSRIPANMDGLSGKTVILVDDTLAALQQMVAAYRMRFNPRMVAVTGSVGKTTTKELIAACLSSRWKTLKTEGNYNNDIGLPLTLLQMDDTHEAAVVEMGMRGSGEIKRLAAIARPQFGVITNVEPVHLETMGSIENIARAKCELCGQIPADGFVLVNGDNELLVKTAAEYPCSIYTFGWGAHCDFQACSCKMITAGMEIELRLPDGEKETLLFPVPAAGLALDALAAAALAFLLGIDFAAIKACLYQYQPSGNRLHMINLPGGGIIIDDTYNANPVSMAAALETGRQLARSGKYAAILGDMFELGQLEMEGHLSVGKSAYDSQVELLLAVGERARAIARGAMAAGMDPARIKHFQTKAEGIAYLKKMVDDTWIILFKASRGMEMETMVAELMEHNNWQ